MVEFRDPRGAFEKLPTKRVPGQLIITGLDRNEEETLKDSIVNLQIGGIMVENILFENHTEMRKFLEECWSLSLKVRPRIPLLIMGGDPFSDRIPLPPPFVPYPPLLGLLATGSLRVTYETATQIALEARSLGISALLSPRIEYYDINDPEGLNSVCGPFEEAAKYLAALVRGLKNSGVSSLVYPYPPRKRDWRREVDEYVIKGDVDGVVWRKLDETGKGVIDGINIIRYDEEMEAGPFLEKSLEKGIDIVIFPDMDDALEASSYMEERVEKSRKARKMSSKACMNVLQYKSKRLNRFRRPSLNSYGGMRHTRTRLKTCERAVTEIGEKPKIHHDTIFYIVYRNGKIKKETVEMIRDVLTMRGYKNTVVPIERRKDLEECISKMRKVMDYMIVLTVNAYEDKNEATLLRKGENVIHFALGNPRDITLSKGYRIVTYIDAPSSVKTACEIMIGVKKAEGRLPVNFSVS
ncbi:MAG TPA: hypothetical protein ENF41_02805 [Candidatus Bathyarchaeota archaeon]|nr:hypothetical protein [Candidatus Bathyarchaeota archaeon]